MLLPIFMHTHRDIDMIIQMYIFMHAHEHSHTHMDTHTGIHIHVLLLRNLYSYIINKFMFAIAS